jgi:hypothetical protein
VFPPTKATNVWLIDEYTNTAAFTIVAAIPAAPTETPLPPAPPAPPLPELKLKGIAGMLLLPFVPVPVLRVPPVFAEYPIPGVVPAKFPKPT